ncbi:hypothetical protein QYE76_057877 [Lolium multiflorum]|uniref:C2H2-type domain-containing protein n=1 Tax=Lolium multiflorum TaxID=4521 RepID=A0AAD8T4F0_LOLMU|nr:hypothetical protein QYE76_057877 [Lolium multiflorum]
MAGSSEDESGSEIEEDEVVSSWYHAAAGSDTDTDDEDARYYLAHHHDDLRGPLSPASSLGSHGTITGAGAAAALANAGFPCPICRRDFTSWKAVGSHMRVHAKVSVAAGSSAGASAVDEVGDSVSVSMPVQSVCSNDPVLNGGSSNRSSVEPIQSGAAAPQVPPVSPPPAPPQQANFFPLMVPLIVPAPQQVLVGGDPPLPAPEHGVVNGPPHIIAGGDPNAFPQAPAGRGFQCRECDRWFPTHQGLGGHAAGHKNRRYAAEARAAAAAGIDLTSRGVPRKPHPCKVCGAEYQSGVSLGGHMRKHYAGRTIVPRERMRLPELALAPPLQQPPPAEPPLQQPPPAAPPVQQPQVPAGSVRLFGVTIVQAQMEEEEPPAEHEQ